MKGLMAVESLQMTAGSMSTCGVTCRVWPVTEARNTKAYGVHVASHSRISRNVRRHSFFSSCTHTVHCIALFLENRHKRMLLALFINIRILSDYNIKGPPKIIGIPYTLLSKLVLLRFNFRKFICHQTTISEKIPHVNIQYVW